MGYISPLPLQLGQVLYAKIERSVKKDELWLNFKLTA